ncbi:MAG: HAD family hydrolase [Candidatus Omnitrophica bacterium]|nr:HAD family hydrolase [Candidatus Omnitrophota bacterium]MDD5690847.1 HAD family hydrolase [Candidatus Omnitrophota bacterium]
MQNIELIIFDLDGTLINAYAAICSSFNYVMRKLGLKPKSSRLIRSLVGWGDANLLKPYVPGHDLKRSLRLYRSHHKISLLKQSHLYPHVRMLLRKLKSRGCKLAVASNRPSRFSFILLRHLRIINFFDYVLCADKLKRGKPDPEILNKIIKRFALNKSKVLYVGDMAIDAQAGRRAMVKTIIVTSGSSSIAEIKREHPFKIISRVSQLAGKCCN